MAYKCRICGTNDVDNPGDVCELCAIGQDPYAAAMQRNGGNHSVTGQGIFQPQPSPDRSAAPADTYAPKGHSRKVLIGGGASTQNLDPYGNSIVPQGDTTTTPVQVYQAGQVPVAAASSTQLAGTSAQTANGAATAAVKGGPLTTGITKNISVDNQKKMFIQKLFRTLFQGIPYTLDDEITMFQVFPDYTGTSLNAVGNACDQVIVYGKLNAGAVAENNDVEVYGHRDSRNNIVATKILNKASGTTVVPERVIPAGVLWVIAALIFAAVAALTITLGVEGIVWAIIIIACFMNLPFILKVFGFIFGILFSFAKRS